MAEVTPVPSQAPKGTTAAALFVDGKYVPYRKRNPLHLRQMRSATILKKYKDHVPIVVEPDFSSKTAELLPMIDEQALIFPQTDTIGKLQAFIRSKIKLKSEQALYFFIVTNDNRNVLAPCSEMIGNVYSQYKAEDGILYMTFIAESTFG